MPHDRPVAAVTMTSAVLDPGGMDLRFARPVAIPMAPPDPDAPPPEEFFCIEPGTGPVTRLELADRLRNPWGILHGGAVAMLADVAACRAVRRPDDGPDRPGGRRRHRPPLPATGEGRTGRGPVPGAGLPTPGRAVVRVAIHDVGAEGRLATVGTVAVLDV